jgi:hypothetical protein
LVRSKSERVELLNFSIHKWSGGFDENMTRSFRNVVDLECQFLAERGRAVWSAKDITLAGRMAKFDWALFIRRLM